MRSNDQSPVTLFSRQVVLGVGGRHDVGGVNHGDLKKEGASCLQIQIEMKENAEDVEKVYQRKRQNHDVICHIIC